MKETDRRTGIFYMALAVVMFSTSPIFVRWAAPLDPLTITAGPEVRNFDQIEVGDKLQAEYFEALAMVLDKEGTGVRERVEQVTGERAEPGDKPAGTVIHTIDAVGTVRDVDREKRLVFVEGTKGMVTLNVPEHIDLDAIEVDDDIRARYVKSVTISVVE